MFKLPEKLLDQIDSMTPEQQKELVNYLSVKIQQEQMLKWHGSLKQMFNLNL